MTTTMTKAARVLVKAVGPTDPDAEPDSESGLGPGEFSALVSVFGNVDSYGDVVMEGAFAEVLADYLARGVPIPIVWSHDWTDPYSHIGHADAKDVEETAEGLLVKRGVLDINSPVEVAAAKAQQIHRLMVQRRVQQFSFAFDVGDAGWGVRGEGDTEREVFELRKFAALHEVGPCLVGVNRDTRLDDVKAVRAEYPKPSRKSEAPEPSPSSADADNPPEKLSAADDTTGDAPGGDDDESPAVTSPDPKAVMFLAAKAHAEPY
jgi:HK97 family phage prohead protease